MDSDGKNLQAYRGTIGFLNDWGSDFTTERRLCWKEGVAEDGRLCVIVGGATVFIWKYLVRPLGGAWNIYELLPAFLLACAAIVVVSLLTKEPEQAIVEEYEHVQKVYHGEA